MEFFVRGIDLGKDGGQFRDFFFSFVPGIAQQPFAEGAQGRVGPGRRGW